MALSIAIVGAGLGGLIFARLLSVSNLDVQVTIFERDPSHTSRLYRGGSLDIHQHTGLKALRKAGLFEKAKDMLRYDGEEITVSDKNGTTVFHMVEAPRETLEEYERPEIDREMLKDLLLDGVGRDNILWGKILESVDEVKRTLKFRDETTAGPFDLIVGADGAFSKLRPLLTDVKPQYAGITGFEAQLYNPDARFPKITKRVGNGSFFAYSDHKTITAIRTFDRSIKLDIYWRTEDQDLAFDMNEKFPEPEKLQAKMLESFQDWVPEYQDFITGSKILRPVRLYELPVGTTWEHKTGFTLIGDAASLMTPFSGEGANKAMTDGLELSEVIVEAIQSLRPDEDRLAALDKAVAIYEHRMFKRATLSQTRTALNKNRTLGSLWGAAWWPVNIGSFILEDLGYNFNKGWLGLFPVLSMAFCYFAIVQAIGAFRRRTRTAIFGRDK